MDDCYVLYAFTAKGCVAKVCGRCCESSWVPVSADVYCVLRWLDSDNRVHAYVQLKLAASALERALSRVAPGIQLRAELRDIHRRVIALLESPAVGWCDRVVQRVRAGPLSSHEQLALSVAGLE